tara:strand:- start:367 stop:495 length:129 start_codon:yes stop_codon:yes gene_type:complete
MGKNDIALGFDAIFIECHDDLDKGLCECPFDRSKYICKITNE